MSFRRKNGEIAWERIAAVAVLISFIWPILAWAIDLPRHLNRIDKSLERIETRLGIETNTVAQNYGNPKYIP